MSWSLVVRNDRRVDENLLVLRTKSDDAMLRHLCVHILLHLWSLTMMHLLRLMVLMEAIIMIRLLLLLLIWSDPTIVIIHLLRLRWGKERHVLHLLRRWFARRLCPLVVIVTVRLVMAVVLGHLHWWSIVGRAQIVIGWLEACHVLAGLVLVVLVLKLLLLLVLGDAAKGSQTWRVKSLLLGYRRLKLIWLSTWAIHVWCLHCLLGSEKVLLRWVSWRRLRQWHVAKPLLIGRQHLRLVLIFVTGLLMSTILRCWKVRFGSVLGQRLLILVVVHENVWGLTKLLRRACLSIHLCIFFLAGTCLIYFTLLVCTFTCALWAALFIFAINCRSVLAILWFPFLFKFLVIFASLFLIELLFVFFASIKASVNWDFGN